MARQQSLYPDSKRDPMQQARQANDKRQLILEAAIRAFARAGYHQSRMADVAREAGVATGTIYLYFKSKEELLISIFAERVQLFISEFGRELQQGANAEIKLRKLIELHLTAMQQYPELAAVLQLELRQSRHFMSAYPKVDLKPYFDLIGEIIEEGQQQGLFRQDLYLGVVKRALFGALDETVTSWLLAGSSFDLVRMAMPLADLFINGLAEPSA
ncbi:MAG: TetR/AcrR family transcriptional regulator [Deltaproteobacteria bacterium]|nr:TetR/AcrR family transcriptional regulator [Deltaproteobacteria bacterium]MBW2070282.1 TetR/AcrR family transcriptional regulator [Deltaproteobacteria bacterium]